MTTPTYDNSERQALAADIRRTLSGSDFAFEEGRFEEVRKHFYRIAEPHTLSAIGYALWCYLDRDVLHRLWFDMSLQLDLEFLIEAMDADDGHGQAVSRSRGGGRRLSSLELAKGRTELFARASAEQSQLILRWFRFIRSLKLEAATLSSDLRWALKYWKSRSVRCSAPGP